MSGAWLAWLAPVFTWLHDLPSYVVAPLFTFLGGAATLLFGPRIQWAVEKKRELRQHQRQLIAQWRAMVSYVSRELARLEYAGTPYTLDNVLRILQRHVDYASFMSTYAHYSDIATREYAELDYGSQGRGFVESFPYGDQNFRHTRSERLCTAATCPSGSTLRSGRSPRSRGGGSSTSNRIRTDFHNAAYALNVAAAIASCAAFAD
jgi:hypothetical protein